MSLLLCTSPFKECQKAPMPPEYSPISTDWKGIWRLPGSLHRMGTWTWTSLIHSAPKPPVLAAVSMRRVNNLSWQTESGNEEALKLPSDNHSGLHFWMFGLSRTADVRIIKFKTAGEAKWPIREWIKTAIYKQDARQFCWAPQYSKYQGSSPPCRAFQF